MNKEKIVWQNERRKVEDLKPFPNNPRSASEKQEEDLGASIEKFDLADPLVINADGTVIGGNFRLRILKKKGIEEVDVRVPSRELNKEEANELNLRLNKNKGEWEWGMLKDFGEDLLKDVGFEEEELIEMFGLYDIENVEVDIDRLRVITVEPPEAPKLKERMAFYCDTIEEYNKIKEFFKKGKNDLDKDKLLEIL